MQVGEVDPEHLAGCHGLIRVCLDRIKQVGGCEVEENSECWDRR